MTRRELGRAAAGALLASASWSSQAVGPKSHGAATNWRSQFPVLSQRVNGHPLVYLDSAATTQRPQAVIDALADYYRHDNANPGAALHTLARRAYERYESARSTVATFINARHADEVAWVRGTTEGINLIATAWARSQLHRGDEILLTLAEHASNMLPWQLVAELTGAHLRYVEVDDAGRVLLDDLDRKLSERTRIFAFSHVSNAAGYINPAADIAAHAHRAGARVLIDAAQSAPHVPLDVQALGCDFLVFSSHKMLGPMGIGVLWARREVMEEMPPYQAGSNMAHEVDLESRDLEHAARKFGAGTPNVSGPIGLATAISFLTHLGHESIAQHERQLTAHALTRLQEVRGLKILGPTEPDERIPVFSFTLSGYTPQQILQHLDAQGIAIRAGDLAALPLLKRLGASAAARASCYLYTELHEVDRLADALHAMVRS
ncbi:MAG TPA: SufS family cysteine desulfurase [Steroidobacteraceae bacterium]|nr:SufS family cysteine desulfurase [Steroidobacteraceae bacterium]